MLWSELVLSKSWCSLPVLHILRVPHLKIAEKCGVAVGMVHRTIGSAVAGVTSWSETLRERQTAGLPWCFYVLIRIKQSVKYKMESVVRRINIASGVISDHIVRKGSMVFPVISHLLLRRPFLKCCCQPR